MYIERRRYAYQIGEIIDNRYRVEEVFHSPKDTTICRCVRVCDGREVVIDCLSLEDTQPSCSSDIYEQRKNDLLKEHGSRQLYRPDWFETEEGDSKRFHVITCRRICALRSTCYETTVHPSRRGIDVDVRSGPEKARASVRKYGDCFLEVEVRPQWTFPSGWWFIMLYVFSVVYITSLGIFSLSIYFFVTHVIEHGMHYGILVLLPICVILVIIPFVFCSMLNGRQYMRVSYTDFEIRRTLGFPNRRNLCPIDPPDGWKANYIDRLVLRQESGLTRDLRSAMIEELWCGCFSFSFIALFEEPERHILFPTLSDSEQEWIAREINTLLERVTSGPPTSP